MGIEYDQSVWAWRNFRQSIDKLMAIHEVALVIKLDVGGGVRTVRCLLFCGSLNSRLAVESGLVVLDIQVGKLGGARTGSEMDWWNKVLRTCRCLFRAGRGQSKRTVEGIARREASLSSSEDK